MAETKTEWITLNVADGTSMRAYVARPLDNAAHTGLLVYQEAFGVNAHIRDVTERFAREGYIAISPELFHRTAPGFEGTYNNFEAARSHVMSLTHPNLEADVPSGHRAWSTNYLPSTSSLLISRTHPWCRAKDVGHAQTQGRGLMF